MDYPHPLEELKADGTIDLSKAYEARIGDWDKVAINFGYRQFAAGTDVNAALDKIVNDAWAQDLRYFTNQDTDIHPRTEQWSNGVNQADELTRLLKIRRAAMNRVGEKTIRTGAAMTTIEEPLVPIYMYHRYAVESASSMLGGQDFVYAMRGDGRTPVKWESAANQRKALESLAATLKPSELTIPKSILDAIPPRPPGYGMHRELFPRTTGEAFDPVNPASIAAEVTIGFVLQPDRSARLVAQSAVDPTLPGLGEVIDRLTKATFDAVTTSPYEAEVRRATERVMVDRLTWLAMTAPNGQVRALASLKLQNLGARVGHAAARAPAARRAVHPVDHVVADVHRVGVARQHLDDEGVAEAGGFERLVPPHRAFNQRLLHVLGRTRIHPVADRRDRLAHRGVRVLLHQAVTAQVAELDGLADRLAEVHERQAAVAGARVVVARRVVAVGQLDERHVFTQRDRISRGRDTAHRAAEEVAAEAAAATAAARHADRVRPLRGPEAAARVHGFVHEGERHVHFGVLREALRVRQVEGAARAVHAVGAGTQAAGRAVHVAQEEVGGVHEQSAVRLGGNGKAPQDRLRERVFHGASFERIGAARPERLVALHEHQARPDTLELDDAALAALTTIEPEVVRTEARREPGREQELRIDPRHFEQHRAGAFIPVQREVAVDLAEAVRAIFDGRHGATAGRRRLLRARAHDRRERQGHH